MLNLYTQLSGGDADGKNALQQWRRLWGQSKQAGILSVLQLCIDMTGYAYTLDKEDLILMNRSVDELLEGYVCKAPFETRNFMLDDAFIENLKDFLKHLIVHSGQELLIDNEWLNKMAKLIIALCASEKDECVMVGTTLAAIMLLNLCKTHFNVQQVQLRSAVQRDSHQQALLQNIQRNIDKICMRFFSKIIVGFRFAAIIGLLTEHVCEMLASFPYMLIEDYKQLNLLRDILELKDKKAVHSVLKYLKSHFTDSICPNITRDVSLFILSIDRILIRVMDTFKPLEQTVIQLLSQACSITKHKLNDEIRERIALRMFSTDEATIGAAIDLLFLHCKGNEHVGDAETFTILASVDAFGRYEYPLSALETLTEKFWQKQFFEQFHDLFLLLRDTLELENSSFNSKTLVHIICHCHQLLMADIKARISPSQEGSVVSWSTIKMRIESFITCYPMYLKEVSAIPDVFNLLLNCLNPEDKELYSVAGVNCEHYYVNVLYYTLTQIALNASEYPVIFRTLSTIFRFDTILHISEDIWKKLSENYYTVFFHTRSRLKTYNLGIDQKLMSDYTVSITRLCVLIEINNTSENVFTLANYLANDLRLLKKMKLSEEANAVFYRLYKNTLYARVYYILHHPRRHPSKKNSAYLDKQVQKFMTELCEQIDPQNGHLIHVGRHIVDTLCNMLLLTQPRELNNAFDGWQLKEYPVEQNLLKNLGIYVERNVFNGGSDEETSVLSAKKYMLLTFNKLYRQHSALPGLADTAHVLKHYGECAAFSMELDELWNIVYSKNANEFYAIISDVLLNYCKKKGRSNKTRNFLNNVQQFHAKHLQHIMEKDEFFFNVVHCIVSTLLNQNFGSDERDMQTVCKIYTYLQPWIKQMSMETRKKLSGTIRTDPNYAIGRDHFENHVIVKSTKQFLHTLKK